MFTHVHYVNGVMVVHSHPSHGKHTHSKIEVVIIARLSSFHSLEADAPIHIEAIRPYLYIIHIYFLYQNEEIYHPAHAFVPEHDYLCRQSY